MSQDKETDKRRPAAKIEASAVRLRIPTLIMAFFLAFVAIAAAYLLGVMSGRHSVLSSSEKTVFPEDIFTSRSADQGMNSDRAQNSELQEQILKPGELEFARVLRRDENTPLHKLKTTPEPESAVEKKNPPDSSTPVVETPKPSLREILAAENGDETSDYLFQVGAFKDEKTVDALREKLEEHGLRTLMKRDGKLYLVLVRLRGTAARAGELVALFEQLRLGEPILRSRTPVKR